MFVCWKKNYEKRQICMQKKKKKKNFQINLYYSICHIHLFVMDKENLTQTIGIIHIITQHCTLLVMVTFCLCVYICGDAIWIKRKQNKHLLVDLNWTNLIIQFGYDTYTAPCPWRISYFRKCLHCISQDPHQKTFCAIAFILKMRQTRACWDGADWFAAGGGSTMYIMQRSYYYHYYW